MNRTTRSLAFLAAAALVAAALVAAGLGCHAAAADDFASHVAVTATTKGGTLKVVLAPKPGWTVNTAYPSIEVRLTAPKGVTLGKAKLGQKDAKYLDTHPGDHAGKAVFETSVKGKAGAVIPGTYKMVICSATTCSPPFHGSFKVTLTKPGA